MMIEHLGLNFGEEFSCGMSYLGEEIELTIYAWGIKVPPGREIP